MMIKGSKSNIVETVRFYDASVKMVWEAWTQEDLVVKWWGPRGFSLTTHAKELKANGFWHYTMHGPDGKDYENTTIYHEVEKYKKLVYDHGGHKDRPPLFKVTAIFEELDGKTKLSMSMTFDTPEIADEMQKFIKQAGGTGTWDRLAEFLEEKQTGKDVFVIARSFEASIEKVFDMWIEENNFNKWMGPTGSTMKFIDRDLRPGGISFYEMHLGEVVMYGKFEYKEISRPNRLQYKQWFSTKEGGMGKHPMAPTWPTYMLTTVTFNKVDSTHTVLSVKWEIFGDASKEERETFKNAKAGMQGGWTGSFDRLEAVLINN